MYRFCCSGDPDHKPGRAGRRRACTTTPHSSGGLTLVLWPLLPLRAHRAPPVAAPAAAATTPSRQRVAPPRPHTRPYRPRDAGGRTCCVLSILLKYCAPSPLDPYVHRYLLLSVSHADPLVLYSCSYYCQSNGPSSRHLRYQRTELSRNITSAHRVLSMLIVHSSWPDSATSSLCFEKIPVLSARAQ
jgi:hypothetical protein